MKHINEIRQLKKENEALNNELLVKEWIIEGLEAMINKFELKCNICLEYMSNPYTTSCGHTFCYHCLYEWFEKNQICPTCHVKIMQETYKAISDPWSPLFGNSKTKLKKKNSYEVVGNNCGQIIEIEGDEDDRIKIKDDEIEIEDDTDNNDYVEDNNNYDFMVSFINDKEIEYINSEEYIICSNDLKYNEFKNLCKEYDILISTFKSKSKDKETDFLFKIFYNVFDIFQENGYLKSRKYSHKFNIIKKVIKVSFKPDNIKPKKIKTGNDDDVDSQIKSIYRISRKEQPTSFDIIINAIVSTEFFVNKVLVKSWATLESYNKFKAVKEIGEFTDSSINKIVLLLTKSIYGNVTNSYLKIQKLLFFAQLLFENGLVISTELNDENYIKFKKKVNKAAINKVRKHFHLAVDLWLWCKTFGLIILAGNPNFDMDFCEFEYYLPLRNKSPFGYRINYEVNQNNKRSSFSTNSLNSKSSNTKLKEKKFTPYTTNKEISNIIKEVYVSDNMKAFINVKTKIYKDHDNKFLYAHFRDDLSEVYQKCKKAISNLEEDIFKKEVDNNQFSVRIEDIQTFVKEFNIMFYENWITELKKLHLYNDIIDDIVETFENLKSNLMDLDNADKKLIGYIKSIIENNYLKIVENLNNIQDNMKDWEQKAEFQKLRDLLIEYNKIPNSITRSMEYPKMLTNLNLVSKELVNLFIRDWTETKKKIGTEYDDDVKKIDNYMSELMPDDGFIALCSLSIIWQRFCQNITRIKNNIYQNFQNFKILGKLKSKRAENLQLLENNLNQILNEIEEPDIYYINIKQELPQ
ncbi:12733_t:CDS:2 [Cetraspora pellucida]|uniref:RING-type E3 ubiquitin transferase n=1 Tax=Cetraspora pellucida TaxID=1433469 RepID=A0A9N9AAC9_9GLOM|nr:12733_t:CDS:2 [Cetraspora pellucida]